MDVDTVTLGFLMSGPKSGYRLQGIANKMMLFYNLSLNQVYPSLRKLEKAGYVDKEVVVQTGKPSKNLFSITGRGREFFFHKLTAGSEPLALELPFLVRSIFFRFLEADQVDRELEKEIQSLDEQLEELKQSAGPVDEQADEHGTFVYRTAVHMVGSLRDWYAQELQNRQEKKE